jgi:predicted DNA-binding helix-hairpin-helix protein
LNVELPTAAGLAQLAPEKNMERTRAAMNGIKARIEDAKAARRESKKAPAFAPAGQSTQMIVGATDAPDATILEQASSLYSEHKLRRVYYSAFSPIPDASSKLPAIAPPLVREHRLYQADWLLRFYGFKVHELTTLAVPNLDLAIDPKLAWALRNRHIFPLDLNKAPRELLLRIPGVGMKSVARILQVRRWHRIRLADLPRLHVSMRKVLPFVVVGDHNAAALTVDADRLSEKFRPAESQMNLFPDSVSALTGQF